MALVAPIPGTPAPRIPPVVGSLPEDTEIVILGVEDATDVPGHPLGEISFPQPTYYEEDAVTRLREFALNRGANLIRITADHHASRHSVGLVSARVYKVPDVRVYEPWIEWSSNRHLTLTDFKGLPPSPIHSHSDCVFYLLPEYRESPQGQVYTQTRFYTRSSWIDNSDGKANARLLHEQETFDLCELYRNRLQTILNAIPGNLFNQGRRLDIFKQVYAAYLQSREQYDSATRNGLDTSQQELWTQRIAADDFPTIPIFTPREQNWQAHVLPAAGHRALVYVIRPNQYNTPFWKRMIIDPYCIWPCPYFLFLNPDRYSVSFDGVTQGPLGVRKFVYRYVPADTCSITSSNGDSMLTLHLEPGKVYFVKMKLIEKRFLAGAHPEWELLSERSGRRWLRKCKLSKHWEYFRVPAYPDPLR
jgi:hypothetical protein